MYQHSMFCSVRYSTVQLKFSPYRLPHRCVKIFSLRFPLSQVCIARPVYYRSTSPSHLVIRVGVVRYSRAANSTVLNSVCLSEHKQEKEDTESYIPVRVPPSKRYQQRCRISACLKISGSDTPRHASCADTSGPTIPGWLRKRQVLAFFSGSISLRG